MLQKLLNILLVLSLVINISLGGWAVFTKMGEKDAKQQILAQQVNEKALNFTRLFVEKVLQGQSEIGFEDRLLLENSVRELNDQAIFTQWQRFTKCKTNEDAQQEAGELFNLLLNKISF